MEYETRLSYSSPRHEGCFEAQRQLYPAQNTLAQIRRDRLLTHVRLYKALGCGWSLSDAQGTNEASRQ